MIDDPIPRYLIDPGDDSAGIVHRIHLPMDTHKDVLQNVINMIVIVHPLSNEGTEAIMHQLPEFFGRLRHDGLSMVSVLYGPAPAQAPQVSGS
jgi:hypothetical protein